MFRKILVFLLLLCLLVGCSVPVEPIPDLAATQSAGTAVAIDAEPRPADATAPTLPATPTAVVQRRSSIAFASRIYPDQGHYDLTIIDAATLKLVRQISLNGLETSPAWSPDAQMLAFVGTRASPDPTDCASGYVELRCNFDIYAVRADGSDVQRLTTDDSYDRDPAWSPDGRQIVFSSRPKGAAYGWIAVMNADGSGLRYLTSGQVSDHAPVWSPDGQSIVFYRVIKEDIQLYRMAADGSDVTPLTSGSAMNVQPAWSPDGRDIAWIRVQDAAALTYGALWLMKSDGTAQRPIKLDIPAAPGYPPAWSPDSLYLVFVSRDEQGYYQLYQVKRDGSGLRAITAGAESQTSPAWSPMFATTDP
jgi:Tol biopolymer transport system component